MRRVLSGRVYLDWNATAPLRPEARAAMVSAMDVVGNPSSVHGEGRAAKAIVERGRAQVAALVGCEPSEIVFTSGATEAAALAVPDVATVSTSAVEHDCVHTWNSAGAGDIFIDVDRNGRMQPTLNGAPFSEALWDDLTAIQAANSETGVVQDLAPLVAAVRDADRGTRILVDLVQTAGKRTFSFSGQGVEFGLLSAHKFGGPPGVGALLLASGQEVEAKARGGGQEMGRRAGTENIAGIAGFGAAAEAAAKDLSRGVWDEVANLRDRMEEALLNAVPDLLIFGHEATRLPNTSCFAVPGWKGETQVMQMDLAGYAISAGSACSSGKVKESRVLRAMGYDSLTASSAIRVSLGPVTEEDEVMGFARTWIEHYRKWKTRAA